MSFTDQKRHVADEKDMNTKWGLDGKSFYCGLCGHQFKLGDGYRWVYANGTHPTAGNFFVCDTCDRPDAIQVRQKAIEIVREFSSDMFVLASQIQILRENKPQYPHHVFCSVFRTCPIGSPGCICVVGHK